MEDLELYIKLLEKVVDNKYRLIQLLIEKGQSLYKTNPTVYNPFYAGDFIKKLQLNFLEKDEQE
ncbi:MAG: hypothetical protein K6343_00870 [Caldisericaceae bacterium]